MVGRAGCPPQSLLQQPMPPMLPGLLRPTNCPGQFWREGQAATRLSDPVLASCRLGRTGARLSSVLS
eukprot:9386426-Alexandrium_andersonii.AAC.1